MIKESLKKATLEQLINEINNRGFSVMFNAPPTSSQFILDNGGIESDSNHSIKNNLSEQKRNGNTLGGKARAFTWYISDNSILIIDRTDAGIRDVFPLEELLILLKKLHETFGTSYFPLANNLKKLADGDEIPGLGKLIYEMTKNVTKAQSASQLVVILKECGILRWNGHKKGMKMCLTKIPNDLNELLEYLNQVINTVATG